MHQWYDKIMQNSETLKISNFWVGKWLWPNDHLSRLYLIEKSFRFYRASAMVIIQTSMECENTYFEDQIVKFKNSNF